MRSRRRRQSYRKSMTEFMVIRPVRLSSKHVLEPGTVFSIQSTSEDQELQTREGDIVNVRLRRFQVRNWFRRGFIGSAEDPWSEEAVEAYGERVANRAERRNAPAPDPTPTSEVSSDLADLIKKQADRTAEEGEDEPTAVVVTPTGGTWFELIDPAQEEPVKLNGQKQVEEYLAEHNYVIAEDDDA